MTLSIIVPVFNEESTIVKVLEDLLTISLPIRKEIVVVDDGSTDKTAARIKKLIRQLADKNLTIIKHKLNRGKGAAIRSGINAATGDYIFIQDADLEYNPREIPKLLSPILSQHKTKIAVYGSRFRKKGAQIPFLYYVGNMFLTHLTNILYGTALTDMETGYKLLPAKFLKQLTLTGERFDIEPEITAKLIKSGFDIIEVPISYHGRSHLSGKKLTIIDAFGAIKALCYFRFFSN